MPLEKAGWRDRKGDDPEYGKFASVDFDEVFFVGDMVTVWGHWKTADSARVQLASVRSALVSPDRSRALLRALRTVEDPHLYCMPAAHDNLEINRSGFVLKGWVKIRDGDSGLDGKDYWSGGVRFPPPIPGNEIVEMMSLGYRCRYARMARCRE